MIKILICNYNELKVFELRGKEEKLLVHKIGKFHELVEEAFNKIYAQLENTNKEVRYYYLTILRGKKRPTKYDYDFDFDFDFDFEIADKVKTVISESITNYREGFIYSMEYHNKLEEIHYRIFADGKVRNRRYKKGELIKIKESLEDNV